MDRTIFALLCIITLLVAVIMYLNWKIQQLDKKVDLYGGLSFGELEALGMLSESQQNLAEIVDALMHDIYPDKWPDHSIDKSSSNS